MVKFVFIQRKHQREQEILPTHVGTIGRFSKTCKGYAISG